MSKKLYVGNLPFSVALEDLEKLFSEFGEIEDAVILSDKYTGRSRGFGFVTFADDAAGDKAIAAMHEKDIEGRKIVVNEAKPMRDDAAKAEPDKKPRKEKKEEVKPKEKKEPEEEPKEEKAEEKEE